MIIGLLGAYGSGKSECAAILVNHGFTELAYATVLKEVCMSIFMLTRDDVYVNKNAKIDLHGRLSRAAVELGARRAAVELFELGLQLRAETQYPIMTSGGRTPAQVIEDVKRVSLELYNRGAVTPRAVLEHVGEELRRVDPKVWIRPVSRQLDDDTDKKYVVSDARHYNEIESIRHRGGVIIRIDRPGVAVTDNLSAGFNEWLHVQPDHVIVNDGTLDELREMVLLTI